MPDLTAYLGDFADQLTTDQRATLEAAASTIEARYPDDDLTDARTNALSAAAQIAFGDATLEGIAATYLAARKAERDAMEALTGAIIWADADGVPQTEIAARTKVTRTTVRKALGL